MPDRVRIDISDHVADVMLDRAEKMNAIDLRMFDALSEAADYLSGERSVRAVVLHGSGKNFSAGIDLGVLSADQDALRDALHEPVGDSPANRFQRAAYAWRELTVPVVAALRGITYGAGFQIAMGADIRFASADLAMSIMESKWGLIPDMAISTTARGVLSPDRAKELAWTGRVLGAEEALQLGLVSGISADPLAAATQLAQTCAERSPDAIQGIKRLIDAAWALNDKAALALEAKLQHGIIGSINQVEAVRANSEGRAPNFKD